MAQEWKPFVEYNSWGWVAGIQRKRWWGRQWDFAYRWSHSRVWEFSKFSAYIGHPNREDAESLARAAAAYRNEADKRRKRERFDVE